jgi:c-di-GMP-binding flagellar brake protein YcgR
MPGESPKPDMKQNFSELRANSRYRLSSPPEIDISLVENGAPIQAWLADLSRGGCYVETDAELPVETEVALTLKKDGDQVKALARVVRVVKNEGLALEFTSMEGEGFRILDFWLSIYIVASWTAANRRRAQRVSAQIKVKVSGYTTQGTRFMENTHTVEINNFGGSVILKTPVNRGQRLVLSIPENRKTVECMVVFHEASGDAWKVGLAFIATNKAFWPIEFEPSEGAPRDPGK